MGKIKQGILGAFSGTVGSIIGSSWNGIAYIKSKPVSVANPRTPAQVNQRNKFRATAQFLRPIQAFVKAGYKFFQHRQTAMNAATSSVIKNAITGTAPDFQVDYALAQLSRGNLTGVQGGEVSLDLGTASFSWTDNSNEGSARADDKAMLLLYNPAKRESVSSIGTIARSEGGAEVTYPLSYAGDSLEVYMAFQAADGRAVSNSVHLGSYEA